MAIITTKQIIDEHYSSYYNYYRKVCYQYYDGRFLYMDLLHELYIGFLKVKEEVIKKFHSIDKLKNIGLLIIRSLFNKRNRQKNHKDGQDSPLSEIKRIDIADVTDIFMCIGIEDENFEDEYDRRKDEAKLDRMNALIMANRDNKDIQLLLLSTNNTIVDIAKDAQATVYHINKDINKAKQLIKENL